MIQFLISELWSGVPCTDEHLNLTDGETGIFVLQTTLNCSKTAYLLEDTFAIVHKSDCNVQASDFRVLLQDCSFSGCCKSCCNFCRPLLWIKRHYEACVSRLANVRWLHVECDRMYCRCICSRVR